jgi:hypothetical protein
MPKGGKTPIKIDKITATTLTNEGLTLKGFNSPGNDSVGNPKYFDMEISISYESIEYIAIYGREEKI